MKKMLSLLLAAALCVGLAGCVSEEERNLKEAMDEANGYTSVDYTMEDGTTLEQQVIYDKNGFKVTVLGLTGEGMWGTLWYRVENNAQEDVNFRINNVNVNGWDMDVGDGVLLESGDMEKRSIDLGNDGMALIDTADSVGSVALNCQIFSGDEEVTFTTDELKTSAYGEQEAFDASAGQVLYDENDVKLVFLELAQEDDDDATALFYVENNREYDISLTNEGEDGAELTFAGGGKLDSYLGETVLAHSKKLCVLYLESFDLYYEEEEYDESEEASWEEEAWDEEEWEEEETPFDWASAMPFTMDLTIQEERQNSTKTIDTIHGLSVGEAAGQEETAPAAVEEVPADESAPAQDASWIEEPVDVQTA